MNHPRMTSSGRQLAFLFAVLVALALPKRVECGYPGGACRRASALGHEVCTAYEIEPLGFFLLEKVLKRDVGFAYNAGEDCR